MTASGALLVFKQTWRSFVLRTFKRHLVESIPVISILTASSLYFALITFEMFWAPAGDAVTHASLTAILQQASLLPTAANTQNVFGIPLTASSAISIAYPPGFPISAALLGVIGGQYPGRAVLLDAGLISSIIPVVVFRLGKVLTQSNFLALLCALLTFLLPDGRFSYSAGHDILMANLINGTYPNHMANLLLLGLFTLAAENGIDQWRYSIVYFGLIVAYPPFFIYPLLIILISWIAKGRGSSRTSVNVRWAKLFLKPSVITVSLAGVVALLISPDVDAFLGSVYGARASYGLLAAGIPPILNWPLFLLPLSSVALSVIILKRGGPTRVFLLSYVALSAVVVANLSQGLFNLVLFLTFPYRMLPLFTLMTTTVLICMTKLWRGSGEPKGIARKKPPDHYRAIWTTFGAIGRKPAYRRMGLLVVITVLMSAVLWPYTSYVPFSENRISPTDLQVLQQGLPLVLKGTLILNDRTFAGLFVPSVEVERIVNIRDFVGTPPEDLGRALETNSFLTNPGNYTYAVNVLHKWNISYVFIGSDYYVLDLRADGTYTGFVARSSIGSVYISFFDNNPYLTAIARSGNSGFYRVL